ncbi:MAG: hypothetical protein WDN46_08520 [Methylocella sp.]
MNSSSLYTGKLKRYRISLSLQGRKFETTVTSIEIMTIGGK